MSSRRQRSTRHPANPHNVQLWADGNNAAIAAITTRQPVTVGPLTFTVKSGILFIELPSGRRLAYVKPRLGENRFGGTSILHDGTNTGRWTQLETYGGKLTENIVQAAARDLLTHGMHHVEAAGHEIVMHVHDEIVVETADATVEEVCGLMATAPSWVDGRTSETSSRNTKARVETRASEVEHLRASSTEASNCLACEASDVPRNPESPAPS